MPKTNVLTIRVPSELKHKIAQLAEEQGVSMNQLALYIFTKEIANIEAGQYFEKFWRGHPKKQLLADFDAVMAKVKKRRVPEWDRLDS